MSTHHHHLFHRHHAEEGSLADLESRFRNKYIRHSFGSMDVSTGRLKDNLEYLRPHLRADENPEDPCLVIVFSGTPNPEMVDTLPVEFEGLRVVSRTHSNHTSF
eukprot:TRINITY_DN2907_c0_g1_i1.p1 TRINITY_DN2907_c0_g1~~TRINITY_DN2907_c0_g1_i1.p1  ORF type:complete len:104 (+),score=23.02 TRINITY_DN2907_c0_g1_i1:38-349(+)